MEITFCPMKAIMSGRSFMEWHEVQVQNRTELAECLVN